MSEVQRYYVGKYGLVEGEALGRINVVLGADHDRVTAERNALQLSLTAADEKNDTLSVAYLRAGEREHELRLRVDRLESGIKWESERNALLLASLTEAEDMLSVTSLEAGQRLTAAEQRNAELEALLCRWTSSFGHLGGIATTLRNETKTALKPTESGASE